MVRDKSPVLIKFGVALAISLGGIIFTLFRIKPSISGSKKGKHKINDQTTADASLTSETCGNFSTPKSIVESCQINPSTSSRSDGDRDVFLLPEFNELVEEFTLSSKNVETPPQDVNSPSEDRTAGIYGHDQEINSLKHTVTALKEREKALEIQLLEYYGLKEQENSVLELQNRLKVNNIEAKLLGLKIESLRVDKMKLEAQVGDYAKVVSELEAAKAKIKQLKKKLRVEADHNREQILTLKERVRKLQEQEKQPVQSESEVQLELQKLKDLDGEADKLRKSNHSLIVENSALAERLESVQILATSVLGDDGTEALREESLRLQKQNEELVKEFEQLQADRCNDAEELVYLRWINACLRYELRNYQPVAGKTVARDLSKTLSPKSEEKAKQLILEYANNEDQRNRLMNVTDFDYWLSSQESYLTDSSEYDDTSADYSSAHKTHASSKSKVFGKLLRLVRGKDHHHRHSSQEIVHYTDENAARCSSYSSGYNSDTAILDAGAAGMRRKSRTSSSHGSTKQFFDFHSLSQDLSVKGETSKYLTGIRRYSDGGSLDYISKRLTDSLQGKGNNHESENIQKSELVKYAEVLRGSCSPKSFRKRSASVSFF